MVPCAPPVQYSGVLAVIIELCCWEVLKFCSLYFVFNIGFTLVSRLAIGLHACAAALPRLDPIYLYVYMCVCVCAPVCPGALTIPGLCPIMQAFYAILNGTTSVVPTIGNQVRTPLWANLSHFLFCIRQSRPCPHAQATNQAGATSLMPGPSQCCLKAFDVCLLWSAPVLPQGVDVAGFQVPHPFMNIGFGMMQLLR